MRDIAIFCRTLSKRTILITASVFLVVCVLSAGVAYGALHYKHASLTSQRFPAAASTLRDLRDHWIVRIKAIGAEAAYAEFLVQAPTLSISTHEQAHAMGEALYDTLGLDGLKICDSSFEFGCYHSFFGLAVHDQGIGALPQFSESCKLKYGTQNLPCEHGIGHGVLVYTNYDLTKALQLCQTISNLPTGGCSSGVFMEYNFHTMDENTDGSFVRQKTDDPYAPCDTLPSAFQASCYLEQVQWWQSVFHSDYPYMSKLCAALPKDSDIYDACYHGMGNYIAAEAQKDFDTIIKNCDGSMQDESRKAMCHEGASWLMRFDADRKDEAQRLCTTLQEPYSSKCLQELQS